jgi:2-C-methyl-D-erythritol 4-phosphate cytidylyltransferase
MSEVKEKQLFVIDGYRIWAYTIEEAQQHYAMISRF